MTVKKKDLIYEGKAKRVFSTSDETHLITEFKNSLTAFNAKKKGSFEGKGSINLKITTMLFDYLKKNGITSHFVENIDDENMVVKKLKMIPLEVVVRNRAAGSFSSRFGLKEGSVFENPFTEFYYKDDGLNDPLLTEDHILTLKIATQNEISKLKVLSLQINQLLKNYFRQIDINLVDFKLEFGKDATGEIILGDEISPDSCRLWDSNSGERLDKDRFRRDLGRVEESYRIILSRMTNLRNEK